MNRFIFAISLLSVSIANMQFTWAQAVKTESELEFEIHIPSGQIALKGDLDAKATNPFVKVTRAGKDLDTTSQASGEKKGNVAIVRALPDATAANKWEIRLPVGKRAKLYMNQGQVTVTGFQADLLLNMTQGQISLNGFKGTAKMHVGKGAITVLESSGMLDIETATASTTIKKFTGPYKILSLSGEIIVENVDGAGDVKSAFGNTKILAGSGGINFDLNRGNLNLQNFKGQVEGELRESNSVIALEAGTQLQVSLGSGKIAVNGKKAPGAQVDLLSSEGGDFLVPNHLNVQKDGLHRVVRGHLKGEKSEARIFVRTKEGNVSVTQ
ncbi:MAG: hypothetical protein AB7O96_11055 [Pseudobdellovibrionaceae bacterium]